jgi:hypothetical protein
MDVAQAFVVYAGWIFSVGWGTVLAALSAIAFGRDILPIAQRAGFERANFERTNFEKDRREKDPRP